MNGSGRRSGDEQTVIPRPDALQTPAHDLPQAAFDAVPARRPADPAADGEGETTARPRRGSRVNVERKEWMVPPASFLPDTSDIL